MVHRLLHHYLNGGAPVNQAEYEDLINLLHKSLHSVGFFRGDHEIASMIQIRELIYRQVSDASDIPLMKAILYKIHKYQ